MPTLFAMLIAMLMISAGSASESAHGSVSEAATEQPALGPLAFGQATPFGQPVFGRTAATGKPVFGQKPGGPSRDNSRDETRDNDTPPLNREIEFPMIEFSDDFSDITGGIGWDIRYDRPVTRFSEREYTSGLLTVDGSLAAITTGAWLLDASMNRQPLEIRLTGDTGFELQPRIIGSPSPGLSGGNAEMSDIGFWNWLYNYRFALTLEAGAEAVQGFDAAYLSAGPGLRIINLEHSGWKGWLPTLALFYEGVFELNHDRAETAAFRSEFSRFRLVHRHQAGFGRLGLANLQLAAGYQYTRDFGQPQPVRDDGYDRRLGGFADLSYAIRWSGREEQLRRVDPFIRFTTGRIAPLIESEQTFLFGVRIPYLLR